MRLLLQEGKLPKRMKVKVKFSQNTPQRLIARVEA
jgi:hypothetical protein